MCRRGTISTWSRRLRIDVLERDQMFVLVDDRCRDVPATILQNRQSGTMTSRGRGSGDALQVVEHAAHRPAFPLGGGAHVVFLAVAEFNDEGGRRGASAARSREQAVDDRQTVRPPNSAIAGS